MGNVLGCGPHVVIDEKRHPLKIWVLVVGATADGKKGTGANRVFSLLDQVDPSWRLRRKNGIASGEAIVHQVRDDVVRIRRVKKSDGTETETGETVEGEKDKRLLLKEEEFSRVLRLARRDGATLSATIREAWDSSTLMTTSKVAPETATNAHVTIIGHITPEELRKYLSDTELANGFANRFLLVCSRRSKRLSRPPRLEARRIPCHARPPHCDLSFILHLIGSLGTFVAIACVAGTCYASTLPPAGITRALVEKLVSVVVEVPLQQASFPPTPYRFRLDTDDQRWSDPPDSIGDDAVGVSFVRGLIDQAVALRKSAARS